MVTWAYPPIEPSSEAKRSATSPRIGAFSESPVPPHCGGSDSSVIGDMQMRTVLPSSSMEIRAFVVPKPTA